MRIKKPSKETTDRIQKIEEELIAGAHAQNLDRARSVVVGNAFGGVTEVGLRANDGRYIYALLQPVEALELIHQLAANVGCHISMAPRRDFGSWRQWREDVNGPIPVAHHPPHPNDLADHMDTGRLMPPPEKQPGMAERLIESDDETLAVEKPRKRTRAKRAAAAS